MDRDNKLTTAWNYMTHLVTTLIVLIQNYIPLKRFTLVAIISLIPSYLISKTRLIRHIFARNETNFAKRSIVLPCETNVYV